MSALEVATAGPYNIFLLLAIGIGFVIAWQQGQRYGAGGPEWLVLLALTGAAGLVGSRVLHFDAAAPAGAKTILGGVLLGTLTLFAGARMLRLNARSPDALAVALPVGFAVGRIGCLLAGCCFGEPTHLPWGAVYDEYSAAFRTQLAAGLIASDATESLPTHPTQLYEAGFALLVAFAVPRLRRRLQQPGSVLLGVLACLTFGRLLLENLRARDIDTFLGWTQVQWLLAGALLIITVVLWRRERRVDRSRLERARVPISAARLTAVALLPLIVLVIGSALFSPLERLALLLFAIPPLAAIVWSRARTDHRPSLVLATPAALSCAAFLIALQQTQPNQPPSSGYPRSRTDIGISYGTGQVEQERIVGQGLDACGEPVDIWEPFKQRYHIGGASLSRKTEYGPRRSTTVRLSWFGGRWRETAPASNARANGIGGGGGSITLYRGFFAVTGGAMVGTIPRKDEVKAFVGIGGLRIGRADGFFGFVGVNDVEPMVNPYTIVRAGLGYTHGPSGSSISVGMWNEDQKFLSGVLTVRDFALHPSIAFGSDYDVRIGISKRVSHSPPGSASR